MFLLSILYAHQFLPGNKQSDPQAKGDDVTSTKWFLRYKHAMRQRTFESRSTTLMRSSLSVSCPKLNGSYMYQVVYSGYTWFLVLLIVAVTIPITL